MQKKFWLQFFQNTRSINLTPMSLNGSHLRKLWEVQMYVNLSLLVIKKRSSASNVINVTRNSSSIGLTSISLRTKQHRQQISISKSGLNPLTKEQQRDVNEDMTRLKNDDNEESEEHVLTTENINNGLK